MQLSYTELHKLLKKKKLVDEPWYQSQYPDVKALKIDPVRHFIKYGSRMLRDPNQHFSTRDYVNSFSDVDFSKVNPLAHYLLEFDPKAVPVDGHVRPDYCLAFYGERALEAAKANYLNGSRAAVDAVNTLLAKADSYLDNAPYSVTQKTTLPPSGELHDYWHPAPYAWPNPDTPDGLPYIYKDGERVPGTRMYEEDSKKYDRTAIQRLFDETTILSLAWFFTGEDRYIRKAHQFIKVWFIDSATRMNPHLQFSQVFMGKSNNQGKPTGLIETKDFYFFLDAVRLVKRSGYWTEQDDYRFNQWCEDFLDWLQTSRQGRKECAATNNHGIAYDLQVFAFQAYLGNVPGMRITLERALGRMGAHFDEQGYQHREMERTTTAHYTAFNLQLWFNFLFLVKNTLNYNLFDYRYSYDSGEQNPLSLGLQWLLPYYKREWPYPQIDEFDDDRLVALYQSTAVFRPDLVRPFAHQYPSVEACNPHHFPHDGVAPFWLFNVLSVSDYTSLINHRAEVYSRADIRKYLFKHLWGGLSQPSLIALDSIVGNPHYIPSTRVVAAWEVSRWHSFKGDDALSYRYIETMLALDPTQALVKEVALAKAYCEMRLGALEESRRTLNHYLEERGEDPDLLLALATTYEGDDERLELVNRMYAGALCCPLKKIDPSKPLSIGNVQGFGCVPVNDASHKVSVIMPVYSAEDQLHIALDSLLAQTWRNIEIVVVDDRSPDRTFEIAKAYESKDARIVALQAAQNGGAYKARNLGLKHATGDFITTHDSDDWSHPQKIEREVDYLLQDESIMGVSACWVRTRADLSFTQNWRPAKSLIHKSESSFLFRRQVYEELGPWDDVRIGGDNEFIGRMMARYGKNSYKVIDTHVPYAFGLDDESSLTRAKATHVSTVYSGLRHVYREIWRWQHERVGPDGTEYRVTLPDKMVNRSKDAIEVDYVLVADCTVNTELASTLDMAKQLESSGAGRLAIFHWPRFDQVPGNFCDEYFEFLERHSVIPVVHGDHVKASHVLVASNSVLQHQVDSTPTVDLSGRCFVLSEHPGQPPKVTELFGAPVGEVTLSSKFLVDGLLRP